MGMDYPFFTSPANFFATTSISLYLYNQNKLTMQELLKFLLSKTNFQTLLSLSKQTLSKKDSDVLQKIEVLLSDKIQDKQAFKDINTLLISRINHPSHLLPQRNISTMHLLAGYYYFNLALHEYLQTGLYTEKAIKYLLEAEKHHSFHAVQALNIIYPAETEQRLLKLFPFYGYPVCVALAKQQIHSLQEPDLTKEIKKEILSKALMYFQTTVLLKEECEAETHNANLSLPEKDKTIQNIETWLNYYLENGTLQEETIMMAKQNAEQLAESFLNHHAILDENRHNHLRFNQMRS